MRHVLAAMLVGGAAGCVSSQPAGMTQDGRATYRVECPPGGGCNEEAERLCGGPYTTIGDDEKVAGAYTTAWARGNHATAQTTTVRRRVTMIVCLDRPPAAPARDLDHERSLQLSGAEPIDAGVAVRCAYWQAHLQREPSPRVRSWILDGTRAMCNGAPVVGPSPAPAKSPAVEPGLASPR
jgi:hypothetical protein